MTFRDFIAQANPRYIFYPHCDRLIAALQKIADGELTRLMVFMPPRHSKSETVSRLFPAYYLLRHAGRFVGLASYGAELAYTLSRAARDFYTAAGGRLARSAWAVKHWETGSGGGMWAAGVGGPMTGRGFSLGLIDDPLKDAEEAASSTIRAKQIDWYGSTFVTRMEPDAAIVLLMTRWHDADLAGYLLEMETDEPDYWHVLDMPALAQPPRDDLPPTVTLEHDPRPLGAALCPERYDADRLGQIRARISEYFFQSLYQQRPRPRSGGMFPLDVPIVLAAPAQADRVRFWDTAGAGPGKGDYTAGVLIARAAGRWTVEDVTHGQWPAAERNAMIRATAEQDRARGPCRIVLERPPGMATEAIDAMIRELAGFVVSAEPVKGDKVSRAEPFASQWQAGNVAIVGAPWNRAYLDELAAFPLGKHDDQVDASSGAFRQLAALPLLGPVAVGSRPSLQPLQRAYTTRR